MKIYARQFNGKVIQTAKIKELGIGGYAFETSLFGDKPYELNVNMPTFKTQSMAENWMAKSEQWEELN